MDRRQEIPAAALGEPMLWRTMEKMLLVVDAESCPAEPVFFYHPLGMLSCFGWLVGGEWLATVHSGW